MAQRSNERSNERSNDRDTHPDMDSNHGLIISLAMCGAVLVIAAIIKLVQSLF